MTNIKKSTRILCLALVILLVSCIGASVIQTNFGSVTIKDLRWETESGHQMSALLLVPDTATADNPAPAIVCSHGWFNNREMQDLNYVEYARRGFVVLSIDMYGHGNSENVPSGSWWKPENNANGMYDAVKLMATLPYVDASRIGVTGHSNGALASRTAVILDNSADTPLIAAALLVSNDAVYTDSETGEYINIFGSRDAGIVACQYDEFFHRVPRGDGSYTPPREFIHQSTAQSFLYYGTDPAGQPERSSYTMYHEDVDGQDAIRAIYNPPMIHPWAHFSGGVVASSVEFFDAALAAPHMLPGTNQIWQWKVVFNTLGIVGFFMFMVGLTLRLVDTEFFAELKADKAPVPAVLANRKGKVWLWVSLIVGVVFSMVMFILSNVIGMMTQTSFFPQQPPLGIGIWSALCGLLSLLFMVLSYRFYGKKEGHVDLKAVGVKMTGKKLAKTIFLGIIVAAATYFTVFVADFFFKTDFRIWCLTFKAFGVDKLLIAVRYLPFFLIYYVLNSVANNCFNYVKMGKHEWVNTLVLAVFNALSPAILIAWMYIPFFISGYHPLEGLGGTILGIWLFPIIVILPLFAVLSRIIYKATKNPYLAGIIMAIIVTIMSCTNTLTAA